MSRKFATAEQIKRARKLRADTTDAERNLWNKLRNRQLGGHKFRRQFPALHYFLDFACEERMLAIELDGGQHTTPAQTVYDQARTATLEKSGWRIVRFWNHDVLENMEGVLLAIQLALTQNHEG